MFTADEVLAEISALSLKPVKAIPAATMFARSKTDAVVRKLPDKASNLSTQLEVECLVEECGHKRLLTISNLYRSEQAQTGRGCPACKGNALAFEKIVQRAALFGLKVSKPENYQCIASDITFTCENGHEFTQSWLNQRGRGCGQCTTYIGEVLARAIFCHYWPDGDWRRKPTVGLIPEKPDQALHYDLASEKYQVVVENHSAYHRHDYTGDYLIKNLSTENRMRYDELKRRAVLRGGRLEGWRYIEVNWSSEDLPRIIAGKPDQVKALLDDFRKCLKGQTRLPSTSDLEIPAAIAPPTSEQIRAAYGDQRRHSEEMAQHGLRLAPGQLWRGISASYFYQCTTCNRSIRSKASSLLKSAASGRGCLTCGTRNDWDGFISRCGEAAIEILNSEVRIGSAGEVRFRCREHDGEIQTMTRDNIRNHLKAGDTPCRHCRDAINTEPRRWRSGSQTLERFRETLSKHGWQLIEQTWKGSNGRDARYEVECSRGHKNFVPIHQFKQKANENGSYNCRECKKLASQQKFDELLAAMNFRRTGIYIDANVSIAVECTNPLCESLESRVASFSNLKKRGIRCVCR
ncbi:hypothetical protein [Rhizobium leguminosarum]|uniref:hypothetical protein n=1 Tax=Rhizobium leguminosarum TaxID=384 RepID=UPI001C95BFAF|nr:hypothetical protein [Rhizobium leguminosarum]MBY5404680.1 hypothetical protein [Rhizobium leguminosarum]